MTRRERKEARLARRLEWAEGRDAKAAALLKRNEPYAGDYTFNTQPGHIPERARAIARDDKAFEHHNMADHHRAKADGIAAQLDRSIFSDDPDAPERLRERIAQEEAKRETFKAANKAYKAGGVDAMRAAVGDAVALEGLQTMRLQPFYKVPYPPYSLTNIGGNIRRLKKRLKEIETRHLAVLVLGEERVREIEAQDAPDEESADDENGPTDAQIEASQRGAGYQRDREAIRATQDERHPE